jgi:hypothetical protein
MEYSNSVLWAMDRQHDWTFLPSESSKVSFLATSSDTGGGFLRESAPAQLALRLVPALVLLSLLPFRVRQLGLGKSPIKVRKNYIGALKLVGHIEPVRTLRALLANGFLVSCCGSCRP